MLEPARCWILAWRDRLAWVIFRLVAHREHADVVWQRFRLSQEAESAVFTMPNGSVHGFYSRTYALSDLDNVIDLDSHRP